MKVLVTGQRGLVGARFWEAYAHQYQLIALDSSHDTRVDITDQAALVAALNQYPDLDAVVHLAAYTNVNGAYEQTGDQQGAAWQVNVEGTRFLAAECAKRGWYLIHFSTAFVFDGQQTRPYRETDAPAPIEWYGQTKLESERVVQASGAQSVILRIDQPFSHRPSPKVDTLWRVIRGLQAGTLYPQFANHTFGPTYIEDLVKVIDFCLRTRLTGLYHATNGESWTDLAFAQAVREILNLPGQVTAGNLDDYLATTRRPYQRLTALDNSLLESRLDFSLRSIRTAIGETDLTALDKESS